MITEHVFIKQLDVHRLTSQKNSDRLLIESAHRIHLNNEWMTVSMIPGQLDRYIHGLLYKISGKMSSLSIEYSVDNDALVSVDDSVANSFQRCSLDTLNFQPVLIVDWVRQFKSQQVIYHQTGATESAGVLLESGVVLMVECLTIETAFLKLVGALIKDQIPFYPVLLVSSRIQFDHLPLFSLLKPEILLSQSSITATALSALIDTKCTVFGFCRKSKYNRYSNFHL